MATELNKDNLREISNELTSTIAAIKEKALIAVDNEEISDSQFQQARDEYARLETQEIELQGLINSLELEFILNTSAESPLSQILQATEGLKSAEMKIDEFDSFSSNITEVINIVASTITAIQMGGL